MADQASSSAWERFGDAASSAVTGIDRMTGAMVDTMTGGSTQMDQLTEKYANSNLLANLLTSNNPTLNVQMGMDLLCDIITAWKDSSSFAEFMKLLGQKVKQMIVGILYQIGRTLVAALCNIVLKLRRMVVAKINQFLAEYVADACLQGLQHHLNAIANPQNPLSIKEFTSSVTDLVTDMKQQVTDVWDQSKELFSGLYDTLNGTEYKAAKLQYEAMVAERAAAEAEANATYAAAIAAAADSSAAAAASEAHQAAVMAISASYDEAIAALQNKVAAMEAENPLNMAFWTSKAELAGQFLMSMICSRTQAFAMDSDFGLLAGIHDQIKSFMQGCLFQQALKSANKFSPESAGTDVMNRLNRLANEGNMFELYNVALAAGIDLSTTQYQLELPSANSWVSSVYGDPYMFAAETPINASQMASFLTDGLPTTRELLSGDVPESKMQQPYVSEVMTQDDNRSAAIASKLNSQIAKNEAIAAGATASGSTTMSVSRSDLDKSYSSPFSGHWTASADRKSATWESGS